MLIPIPIFIPQFPFVKFEKRHSPNEYLRVKTGECKIGDTFKVLMKKNRDLLLLNQVPINKVRFIFHPCFTYDIDKDIINPPYDIFIPLRKDGSGLFDKNAPVIELNKPNKLKIISVDNYKVNDNYAFIKEMIKNSKRGVVIFLADEVSKDFKGNDMFYRSEVDSEVLRITNLDEVVADKPENTKYAMKDGPTMANYGEEFDD